MQQDDAAQAEVRKMLVAYNAAVRERNGEAATNLVSKRTHEYFERTRKSALYDDEATLKAKPVFDRMMILSVRTRGTADELEKLDGRGVFSRGVAAGFLGAAGKSFADATISVNGDSAKLSRPMQPWDKKPPTEDGFRCYREGGAWKLDIVSIGQLAADDMEKRLKKIDPDVNVAIVKLMKQLTKKELDDVWTPLRKAP